METPDTTYAILSFSAGCAVSTVLLIYLLVASQSALRSAVMVGAVVASLAWQASGILALVTHEGLVWVAFACFDLIRAGLWTLVLMTLFRQNVPNAFEGAKVSSMAIVGLSWFSLSVVTIMLISEGVSFLALGYSLLSGRALLALWLGLSIAGLAFVEQVLRNTPASFRWAIKPICIGLGGAYAFDLYCFADAFLFGQPDPVVWSARGLVHSLTMPFIALSIARAKGWKATLTVSRQIAFHSTAILASGLYLIGVAGGGYYLKAFGGEWARFLQVTFVFGAVLVLLVLFWSGTIRSRIRVWVSKHFFSYRFDYREQWLNFTRALSDGSSEVGIYERCVKALTDLVESPGGGLWLSRDGEWRQVARWSMPEVLDRESLMGNLPQLLGEKGWVLDIHAARNDTAEFDATQLPKWLMAIADAWIVVPLMISERELFGFVIFLTPRSGAELNWEVLDLLKTAGRQCASYLAQIEASEALLEAKKFDAFNKLSAFVVHDLKNLIAQMSLLLKNAERHKDNPEFQKDLLLTVEHVVKRMHDMLFHLRTGAVPVEKPKPVDLGRVMSRISETKAAQRHRIVSQGANGVMVLGHEDRLERVVGHLIQNALDASGESGQVTVRVESRGNDACIMVMDSGKGMTPEFIRDKLFKPFQTTKETGMGIGAYESQQYVQSLGGRLLVESQPDKGTTITVELAQISAGRGAWETE